MVYSGDTSPCERLIEHARDADLLIHECSSVESPHEGHTSLEEIRDIANRISTERIILVHLPPLTLQEEGAVRRRLRAECGGRIQLGEDGAMWEVGDATQVEDSDRGISGT
jgi:ribonuclease BN (tRNA processing enzyme)